MALQPSFDADDIGEIFAASAAVLRAGGYAPNPLPKSESARRDLLERIEADIVLLGSIVNNLMMLISLEKDALKSPSFDKIPEPAPDPFSDLGNVKAPEAIKHASADEILEIVDSFLTAWKIGLEARKAHIEAPSTFVDLVQSLLGSAQSVVPDDVAKLAAEVFSANNKDLNDATIRLGELARRKYLLGGYRKLLGIVRGVYLAFDGVASRLRTSLPESNQDEIDDLVTLDQVAPLAGLSKRSLERYLSQGKLPEPDIAGGGGKAHKWAWQRLRANLESVSNRTLPSKFPGSRII